MDKYRVKPGQSINLKDWDTNEISLFPEGKKAAKEKTKKLNKKLEALQELLYAEHKHKVLVVLQALDTGR